MIYSSRTNFTNHAERIEAFNAGKEAAQQANEAAKSAANKKVTLIVLGLLIGIASGVGIYFAFTSGGTHYPGYVIPAFLGIIISLILMGSGCSIDTDY